MTLAMIFVLIALICFICAAVGIPASRVAIGWVGLAFYMLSLLVGLIR